MAVTAHLRARYEDGYVLVEDAADESAFVAGENVFADILNSRPCAEHGPMVEFALITPQHPYVIDWTELPVNARPIRFKNMRMEVVNGVPGEPFIASISFGWQYTDEATGRNVQRVTEIV